MKISDEAMGVEILVNGLVKDISDWERIGKPKWKGYAEARTDANVTAIKRKITVIRKLLIQIQHEVEE